MSIEKINCQDRRDDHSISVTFRNNNDWSGILLHFVESLRRSLNDHNSGDVGSALYSSQHINTSNKTLLLAVLVVAMIVCNFCNYIRC